MFRNAEQLCYGMFIKGVNKTLTTAIPNPTPVAGSGAKRNRAGKLIPTSSSTHPSNTKPKPERYKFCRDRVQRTLRTLKNTLKLNWKSIRKAVTTFVENCPCCQKMRRLKSQIHNIRFTLASYQPMKRVCVDATGPITINDTEYKHILVFIDAFSRYAKLCVSSI